MVLNPPDTDIKFYEMTEEQKEEAEEDEMYEPIVEEAVRLEYIKDNFEYLGQPADHDATEELKFNLNHIKDLTSK